MFQEVSPISCFRNELGAWVITRDEGGRAGVVQKKGVILKEATHTPHAYTWRTWASGPPAQGDHNAQKVE